MIDVKTLCDLGQLFIDANRLKYHNIERHVTVKMWLQGRVSTRYVCRDIELVRSGVKTK